MPASGSKKHTATRMSESDWRDSRHVVTSRYMDARTDMHCHVFGVEGRTSYKDIVKGQAGVLEEGWGTTGLGWV